MGSVYVQEALDTCLLGLTFLCFYTLSIQMQHLGVLLGVAHCIFVRLMINILLVRMLILTSVVPFSAGKPLYTAACVIIYEQNVPVCVTKKW